MYKGGISLLYHSTLARALRATVLMAFEGAGCITEEVILVISTGKVSNSIMSNTRVA